MYKDLLYHREIYYFNRFDNFNNLILKNLKKYIHLFLLMNAQESTILSWNLLQNYFT